MARGHVPLRWACCAAALQSQSAYPVLLPERFRASCAFGAPLFGHLGRVDGVSSGHAMDWWAAS